nr:DNA helicase [Tanacetum cinerariifolium]
MCVLYESYELLLFEVVINRTEDAQLYLDVYRKYSRVSGKIPCVQQGTALRGDGLDKCRLQPSRHYDIFEAYLALCSSGADSRRSRSVSQITPVFNFNLVHSDFSSLCGLLASLSGRSFHANTIAVIITGDSQNSYLVSRDGGNKLENCQLVSTIGTSYTYSDLGDYDWHFRYCRASFCALVNHLSVKSLFENKHFMENIRAYNQMQRPGQIYHWIGSLCPTTGEPPRFLQLYIYDNDNEVHNRMQHFEGIDKRQLESGIVEEFKRWLYNAEGTRGYELPTSNALGAMVFGNGERAGYEVGGRIILLMSFTGGPRYIRIPKRGLPHCHTLLWVDSASKIRIAGDVDRFISIELPDLRINPEGYNVVSELMMHGPCGAVSLKAPEETQVYLLQETNSSWIISYVVPYNRDLLLAFQAHINVEYYGWSMLIKYLFKILKFDIHRREPAVQILAVHLEDMQRVTFRDQHMLESMVDLLGKKSTTLTEWFAFNRANEAGRHLSYLEVACQALDLLGDDKEWEIAFEEACGSATPEKLRFLYSYILLYCDVANPSRLWRKYWKEMSYDIPKKVSKRVQIPDYHLNDDSLQGYTLYKIEIILSNYGKSLHAFGLPPPPQQLLAQLANRLLMEERNYNREELAQLKDEYLYLFMATVELAKHFSGKPSLVAYVLKERLYWQWRPQDEGPMNDRRCFEALNRSLRDIVDKLSSLFGGKLVLLGGDFWQTLPVKKHKMRLARPNISLEERSLVNSFASWLLAVGDGKIGEPVDEDPENMSWVLIPHAYCLPPDEQGFPPYQIELKVVSPVMLLRNVNIADGLCNGTRMIVRQLIMKLIEL